MCTHLNGNIAENDGNTLSKLYDDLPLFVKASRLNLTKFVVIKHFGWDSLRVEPFAV